MTRFEPTRRSLILGATTIALWSRMPRIASAAGSRERRFIHVTLRGAMDGLGVVAPTFDPDYVRMRGPLAVVGEQVPGLDIDGFALNPRLETLGALFKDRQALAVHAVTTGYRGRSHFDGQDVLESGQPGPGMIRDGWLNRALQTLPDEGRVGGGGAFAVGSSVPLIMRGAAEVATWLPPGFAPASADTRMRLLDLYNHTAPDLAKALESALKLDTLTGGEMGGSDGKLANASSRSNFAQSMGELGKLFARPDGPRIGAIDIDGWDTHANEDPVDGRLGKKLSELDGGLAALRQELGAAWSDTVIAISTEFGRTVRMNGTEGTDHGTATVAFLLGGAVAGGRVIADWPGLSEAALHEGRDLAPTADLRGVMKGVLRDHLGFDDATLATTVFPESRDVRPVGGLLV
jgi:Uncharacterized protein conserved in bacteria